jgi:hypothetical protein
MEVKVRFFTTVFIWAVAVVAGLLLSPAPYNEIATLFIIASTVLISMGFVWNWGRLPLSMTETGRSREGQTKAKRGMRDKAALLRELLDEDELEAVKRRLMADVSGEYDDDDGELPLAALLEPDENAWPHH